MASTHPPVKHQSQHQDDLKQIHGIGPAMEQRLNQAGIFTFAQFATMSAEEISRLFAHLPGLTTERIIEKGWIKQAKELSEKKPAIETTKLADDGQYSAVFSIDLLLNNQNQIRRTHVIHAQSREQTNWAGWDQEKLVGFILKNASVKPARLQAESLNFESEPIDKNQGKDKKTGMVEIQGELSLPQFDIRPETGSDTHWHIHANKPFSADLKVDLDKTNIPPETSICYQAFVYAKDLANGQQTIIGDDQGVLLSDCSIPLAVKCHELPIGAYRLEAFVMVSPEKAKLSPKFSLTAMTEGRIFKVS